MFDGTTNSVGVVPSLRTPQNTDKVGAHIRTQNGKPNNTIATLAIGHAWFENLWRSRVGVFRTLLEGPN